MISSTVSVVIPTYNGSAFLAEAVESVWRQTQPPAEIVVVDDCSTDGTVELADDLARRSPAPMRVIRLRRNSGGPARPINVGVESATGDLIAVLDQDDVFDPQRLEAHERQLAGDPRLSVVTSGCGDLAGRRSLQSAEIVTGLIRLGVPRGNGVHIPGPRLLEFLLERCMVFMGYPAFTFRRSDWNRNGGADTSLRIGSDYDVPCRLCLIGDAVFLPVVHYRRRQHDGNMCRNVAAMYLDIFRVRSRYIPRCRSLCQAGPGGGFRSNENTSRLRTGLGGRDATAPRSP